MLSFVIVNFDSIVLRNYAEIAGMPWQMSYICVNIILYNYCCDFFFNKIYLSLSR